MKNRLEQRALRSARIDDNPDAMLRRLRTFQENNALVLEHLQKNGPIFYVSGLASALKLR